MQAGADIQKSVNAKVSPASVLDGIARKDAMKRAYRRCKTYVRKQSHPAPAGDIWGVCGT